jgi:predicted component of type VI protein secretion system
MARPSLSEHLADYERKRESLKDMKQVAEALRNAIRDNVTKMLADAEREYQDAAAMHSMGKVGHEGGRIAAFKAVLELLT